jgi:hypothetical protein
MRSRRRRASASGAALPAPRPLLAPLRTIESAQTSLRRLPDNRLLMTIRHAPLRGITPEMLCWWFQSIEGTVEIDGREYPRYLVWHPFDHIDYRATRRRDGTIGAGVRFTIVEAFGRDASLSVPHPRPRRPARRRRPVALRLDDARRRAGPPRPAGQLERLPFAGRPTVAEGG